MSKTTVQKLLADHQLSAGAQRVAKAAEIAAVTQGLLTEPHPGRPFGFCHWAARPGDLVAVDRFYIGNLKGIGPVWQLTAIDTATRWAIGVDHRRAPDSVRPPAVPGQGVRSTRRHGHEGVPCLSDNGPE